MKILRLKIVALSFLTLCGMMLNAQEETTDTSTQEIPVVIADNEGPSAESIAKGKDLFTANCKACHALDMRLVGPPLKGVRDRRSEDWIIQFVQGSNAMIASGDTLAISLFNEYNKIPMPDQPVSAEEVGFILDYIDDATKPKTLDDGGIPRPEITSKTTLRPMKFTDYRFWILYTITVVLLIVAVYFKAESEALKKINTD